MIDKDHCASLEDFLLLDDAGIDPSKGNYSYLYKANRFKGRGGSRVANGRRVNKYPYNLAARFTPEAYEKIKNIALDLNVSESEAMRRIINKALGL